MSRKQVLFIVFGGTLGHVKRSLIVGKELRRQVPQIEISWLVQRKEATVLEAAGEKVLPEAAGLVDAGAAIEMAANGYRFNLTRWAGTIQKDLGKNFEIYKQIIRKKQYDLLIGDTAFEIDTGFKKEPAAKTCPYVSLHDHVGLDAMTRNPAEHLLAYYLNWSWVRCFPTYDLSICLAHEEDIPDRRFGLFLPKRLEFTRRKGKFVGYVPSWASDANLDHESLRAKLGYGEEPLIVCSVGGSAATGDLLHLCAAAYPVIKQEIRAVRMVLVCGPRVATDSVTAPEGVEVLAYVPRLYEYFAACDLAVVHGGGTGVTELTALRRPFIYFPLVDHYEQAHVAYRVARWGSGVKMSFPETSAEQLAAAAIANLGREMTYPPIAIDGAAQAARHISELLNAS